jgi:hypothetical protein
LRKSTFEKSGSKSTSLLENPLLRKVEQNPHLFYKIHFLKKITKLFIAFCSTFLKSGKSGKVEKYSRYAFCSTFVKSGKN